MGRHIKMFVKLKLLRVLCAELAHTPAILRLEIGLLAFRPVKK